VLSTNHGSVYCWFNWKLEKTVQRAGLNRWSEQMIYVVTYGNLQMSETATPL
jgi:hypothetical protein